MASKRRKLCPDEARRVRLLQQILEGRMPAGQAENAAWSLWSTWGSLGSIILAPEESLAAVPGMDRDAARCLRLVLELARAYLEEQTEDVNRVTDARMAAELFRPMYLGRRSEAVGAVLLDGGRRVIYSGIVCEGAVSAVPLYVRTLVRLCIDYGADSFLLAHNHTSGNVQPSKQDILTTKQLQLALGCIDVRLRDHIILTDSDRFSFSESGLLRSITEDELAARRVELTQTIDLVDRIEGTDWTTGD